MWVAWTAFDPGLIDVGPGPFGDLVLVHLIDPVGPGMLSAREEDRGSGEGGSGSDRQS